ncbi:type I restriction endonuclease subunit R [Corynebacterium auriscanis]|uniref:type I restriction endonuclease subunit R n=1 Tax=Corynebacterium auriscanis TaxID=99807 RepID=UPI003CEB1CCD
MMFTEANTVRDYVRDLVVTFGMTFISGSQLPRDTSEVLLEDYVSTALANLNPEIAADPAKADEVLHNLRAILFSARNSPQPVVANEEFMQWLTGQRSMPFGKDGEHTSVRLIDFDNPANNNWVISTEVTMRQSRVEKRFDLVLWCNGFPLVIGEAKSATSSTVSWVEAAAQIHDDYEKSVPQFFVPNVMSFATEGKDLRYGTVGMPVEKWGPWRDEEDGAFSGHLGLDTVRSAVEGALNPESVLEFLRFFTVFATDSKHRRIKQIARYQQFQATNLIVDRVLLGETKKGLIWHFQGSGKSLLMVFTALKLRALAALTNPTILIVVDRRELDTQITATFNAADVPGLVATESRAELKELLSLGARKIIVTTIQKFGELEKGEVLDNRDNIIAMVDEAHRSQEGDYGRLMRQALPNAFLFGLTGTPINRRDRNTFMWFGSDQDEGGYLSRYSFAESIRDGATLPLHFEPRLSEIHVDQDSIDLSFDELVKQHESLSEKDKITLSKRAASIEVLIKAPTRIEQIAADIAAHFTERIEPQGFKGQVVAYDKHTCIAYKRELDKHLPEEASTIVMSKTQGDPPEWAQWTPSAAETEALLKRFNDPSAPLKIIIVTARLLTGFDAPILQTQYLDKPLRDHTLLQAITRTNRTYPPNKTHGLIVDYLGVFDDVAASLQFDDSSVQKVISNIEELKAQFPVAMEAALSYFPGVNRTVGGYEGLVAAQTVLGTDEEKKDKFGQSFSVVTQLWDALSPDPMLAEYEHDYRWLVDVYESLRPADTTGKLIWRALGSKTLDLINQNIRVELPDESETITLDAETIEDLLGKGGKKDPDTIIKEITARIARHLNNPQFVELGKRLNDLRERYSEAQQSSLEFLRKLLELAKDTVSAEKALNEVPREERGKAALTELFEALKDADTPVIVEKVVERIDEVVRAIRFEGWQATSEGDREVKQALRQTLYLQFKIRDEDVFKQALGYVREYY